MDLLSKERPERPSFAMLRSAPTMNLFLVFGCRAGYLTCVVGTAAMYTASLLASFCQTALDSSSRSAMNAPSMWNLLCASYLREREEE
jgi:hypothetical protein